ncbi:LptA/OstA family protein, partial [Desulfurella multipotens]|uniref:LptA/OstA family protein n=3 Tax=Desulfurella TaxID=33001 RepID=UPI000CC259C1
MKKVLIFVIGFFILTNLSFADNPIESAKKEKVPINITADKLIAQENIGLYTFIGNVVAKRKDATLYADKMDVYKDKTTGDV